MDWYIWVALGVICMIIEIFTPGFFFFGLGAGAIITGVFTGFANVYIQLAIFAISTTVSFLLMKRFAGALLKKDNVDSNVYALIGKRGMITKDILPGQKGYVKVESEEWSAVAVNPQEQILQGSIVEVVKHEGNKLFFALPET